MARPPIWATGTSFWAAAKQADLQTGRSGVGVGVGLAEGNASSEALGLQTRLLATS